MNCSQVALRLALLAGCACANLSATVTYYTNTNGQTTGFNFGPSNYNPNGGFSTSNGSVAAPLTGIERTESWSATANLPAGTLHVSTAGAVYAGSIDITDAFVNTFASMGDTLSYTGTGVGGLNLSARVKITGNWNTFADFGSTITNYSYLRILFLKPGSFDTANFFADDNIISQAFYGLGPDATQLPFFPAFTGTISAFPGFIDLPVPLSSLPQGTQVALLAQNWLEGTMPSGGTGFGWTADLGHTLEFELMAPEGVTLTTAGGLPTGNAAPEPGSLFLVGGAFVAGLLRRRRSRV